MNVCFWNDHFALGGVERVNAFLGTELNKAEGVNVYLVASTPGTPYFKFEIESHALAGEKASSKKQQLRKAVEMFFNFGYYDAGRYQPQLMADFISFVTAKEIEIVVVNQKNLATYLPFLKRKLPNVKFVSWMHESTDSYKFYENPQNSYEKSVFRRSRKRFEKAVASADCLVCLTQEEVPLFKQLNQNTISIPNPITMEVSGKSSLTGTSIAFLGRMAISHKGLDYLVQVAKDLPAGWQIEFGGDGPEKQIFFDLLAEYDVADEIKLLGSLDDNGIKELFERASLYIMTSRTEGFPLVLGEAMSFGLPIIAFDQQGSREVLASGEYGVLVENGNIRQMVAEIKRFTGNRDLMLEYQQKSLQRAADLSLDKIAKQWLALFKNL